MSVRREPFKERLRNEEESTFSSESEDDKEDGDNQVRRSLKSRSNPPKGRFRYISLMGESETDEEDGVSQLPKYVSGEVDRAKTTSTPKVTVQSRRRVSFNLANGEPSAIEQTHNKKSANLSKEQDNVHVSSIKKRSAESEKSYLSTWQTIRESLSSTASTKSARTSPRKNQVRKSRPKDSEKAMTINKGPFERGGEDPFEPAPIRGTRPTPKEQTVSKQVALSGRKTSIGQSESRRKSKPKKRHQDLNVLRQIKILQRSTDLLIRKRPFARLVREVASDVGAQNMRWTATALQALQESTEAALVSLFEKANLCCLHARRVTLRPEDIHLACRLTNFC